jgi:hypothetical protein
VCLKHASEARHVSTTKKALKNAEGLIGTLPESGHGSHEVGPTTTKLPSPQSGSGPCRFGPASNTRLTRHQRNSPLRTSRQQCCEGEGWDGKRMVSSRW